ncbi:YesL family protein [Microbacterium sp. A93]|uniref:YesL family protein n=1 Tax=Microbacterium sp. A93 TaxID=3450716 RepID=UPI003F43EF90
MIIEHGWAGRVMTWLRVVSTLIIINLMFLAGVLVGLVVLGVMPAAVAATACLTRLRDGENDGMVRAFIASYRGAFWRANLLGVPFAIVLLLILADTAVLPLLPAPASAALVVVTWAIAAIAVVALVAVLTIDVRYEDRPLATLRYAVMLPLVSPLMSAVMLVSLLAVGAALALLPMLVPLVGISVPLFISGWFIDHRLAGLDPGHPRAAERPPVALPAH